jgi:hypothetical protein
VRQLEGRYSHRSVLIIQVYHLSHLHVVSFGHCFTLMDVLVGHGGYFTDGNRRAKSVQTCIERAGCELHDDEADATIRPQSKAVHSHSLSSCIASFTDA